MSSPSQFQRPPESGTRYPTEVVIDEMEESSGVGGGVANFLSGYVLFKGEKFPFEAVAYGRIGGQNVSPSLTAESIERLQKLKVDLETFTAQLQRKLVEGEITVKVPEGTLPPELGSDH